MKKSLKYLTLMLLMFMISLTCVQAKKIKISELDDEIIKVNPNPDYAYIIGEYIFTSGHKLTTQDIMLASRSIQGINDGDGKVGPDAQTQVNASAIYDKMTITVIKPQRVNGKFTWVVDSILAGTTTLNNDSEININYIDYNFVKEDSKIDNISETITNYQDKLTMPDFSNASYNEGLTITSTDKVNYEAKGLLLYKKDATITGLEGNKTGYYMAFALNIPDLNLKSTLTIKDVDEGGYSKTFTNSDYKTDSDKGTAIIWPVNPNSQSKKIEITLDIDGEEGLYGETKYYITWDEELQFQGESELKIEMPNGDDETLIKNKFNYTKTEEDTYTLSFDEASKTYTLKGDVIYQEEPNSSFATDDPKGYYVLIKITDDKFIKDKTTIKLEGTKTKIFTIDDDDKTLLLLLALDSASSTKEYKLTVDLDGEEGHLYSPVEYKLTYGSDLHFKQRTEFTLEVSKDGLNEEYNYNGEPSSISIENNVLTGPVLITEGVAKTTLGEDNLTNYYVPIKLNITNQEDGMVIKVNGTETKDTTLLLPVTESKKANETFTIEVDADGDGNKYIAKKVILSYKDLVFQKESEVKYVSTIINGNFDTSFDVEKQNKLNISLKEPESTINLTNIVYAQDNKNEYIAFAITIDKKGDTESQFELNATGDGEVIASKVVQASVANAIKKIFLYKLPSDLSQSAKLTIDLDGNGNEYAPKTYTIDFSGINLIKLYTITFTDVEDYGEYKEINVYSDQLKNLNVADPKPTNSYITFDHWVDAISESHEEVNLKEITKDVTVKPYFNVNLDSYMNDYQTKFNVNGIKLEKDADSYNFKITDPTFAQKELDSLSSTNLVNKLSGILTDFKATKLTINSTDVNDADNITTTLKDKLNSYRTYADLINADDFTLTVEVTGSDAYKLNDGTEKTYTFKFDSDFRIATNKTELTTALGNSAINKIYIKDEIDLDNSLEISKSGLTIEGLDDNSALKSSNTDSVIKVSNDVTIKNLIVDSNNASSKGILVTSGTLTADKLTVKNTTPDDKGVATAIEVDALAKANVTKLTFEDESYDSPAIRSKSDNNVTLYRTQYNTAAAKVYEEIKTSNVIPGDKKVQKSGYDYKHYYLNSDNETKWFTLIFESDNTVIRPALDFYRYVEKKDIDTNWKNYTKNTMLNGEEGIDKLTKYTDGLSQYEVNTICGSSSSGENCVELSQISTLPVPTGNTNYVVKLKYVGTPNNVIVAHNVSDLRDYLSNPEYNQYTKIYLDEDTEYDLEDTPLKITRSVIINGALKRDRDTLKISLSSTIKGQIIIDAENVNLTQLIVKGSGSGDNVITVNKKDFYLYQSELSIEANANFKNMIYYDLDLPKTDILFTKFADQQNVLNSFIEFSGSVGTTDADNEDDLKTELLGNTFEGGTNMKTFIKIDSLQNENPLNIILRQSNFKFQNADAYALEIAKTPTGNNAIDFDFGISYVMEGSSVDNIRVRIDVDSNGGNASSITFNKDYRFQNLEIHYFQGAEDRGTDHPSGKSYEAKVEDYGNK